MKKNIRLLFIALSVILFASCSTAQDDLFDDPSATRIENSLKEAGEILTNAPNGWVMEFFPSDKQRYGGYNLLLSFTKEGQVTATNEVYKNTEKETSTYLIRQISGPVISFDTYNPAIHFFSDPKNPLNIGKKGKGMEGDLEFLILKASKEEVILQGRKTRNTMKMTPIEATVNWTDYINTLKKADAAMLFKNYQYEVNGKIIPFTPDAWYRVLSYTIDGSTTKVPYIRTPTGIRLYKPLEIEGVTVEEFKFEESKLHFIPTNGAPAKLTVVILPLNKQLVEENWYFAYSKIGDYGKPGWTTRKAALPGLKVGLHQAYMGKIEGGYGFCAAITLGGASYVGRNGYTYELVDNDKVKYTYNEKGNTFNGSYFINKFLFNELIVPIGYTESRTFTLTADDLVRPTWIQLQDVVIANNTITLYKQAVSWPFDM